MSEETTDADVLPSDVSKISEVLAEKKKEKGTKEVTEEEIILQNGAMQVGENKFGITCTGKPLGRSHWLADSSVCGDQVMALPSSVLIAGRTKEAGGVGIDMMIFIDSVIEGAGRLCGIDGICQSSTLPKWAVSRMLGTFPALMSVYHEAIDQAVLAVEGAAMKAAIGVKVYNRRRLHKDKGGVIEKSREVIEKNIMPDPALSKLILTSRMKSRYKDDGDVKQAVQINFVGAEADL